MVIPKEIRKALGIEDGDPVEIAALENAAIIRKFEFKKRCKFCGTDNNLIEYNEGHICKKCLGEINKIHKMKDYLI